jgi:hypothetical protein
LSVEAAGPLLKGLLARMPAGEKLNLVGPDGKRVAVVYCIKPEKPMSPEEWLAEWDALTEEISKAWKSEKSAVELVSEMRR